MKNNVKIKPTSMIGETGVFWDTGSRGTVRGKSKITMNWKFFLV
jgi:hypothetical protein